MRVYITGIAGFLGSHLADHLAAAGHTVFGCDDFSTGSLDNLTGLVGFAWRNIIDLVPEDLEGFDVVYHCAAAAYEGASNFSPAFISRNIYAGSAAVFSAAIASGVKRVVFTSTMARYGEPYVNLPFIEDQSNSAGSWHRTVTPVDPYGIAKEAAERLLINLAQTHGVEWSIAVPHNIYGPRQRYVDPYRNVAAIFANRMLQDLPPQIYGDGRQVRCFSYIDDVVPGLARMGLDDVTRSQIINLGPDSGEVSIVELSALLAEIVGYRGPAEYLPGRPREVRRAVCSSNKARQLLGFEQKTELRQGLEQLVDWIRARGARPFEHHLAIELKDSPLLPATWYRPLKGFR
jgi:UDP-glucose 4-epimerase